jgi:hypothetical protein
VGTARISVGRWEAAGASLSARCFDSVKAVVAFLPQSGVPADAASSHRLVRKKSVNLFVKRLSKKHVGPRLAA